MIARLTPPWRTASTMCSRRPRAAGRSRGGRGRRASYRLTREETGVLEMTSRRRGQGVLGCPGGRRRAASLELTRSGDSARGRARRCVRSQQIRGRPLVITRWSSAGRGRGAWSRPATVSGASGARAARRRDEPRRAASVRRRSTMLRVGGVRDAAPGRGASAQAEPPTDSPALIKRPVRELSLVK